MGDWFNEWVDLYCQATGGDHRVKAVLLSMRHVITVEWAASVGELGACVSRLVSGCRVPNFPSEVTNALGAELRLLRTERAQAAMPDHGHAADAAAVKCVTCGDTGFVTVPHRWCVWDRRISFGKRTGFRFVTGAVLCDRPGCPAGMRVRDDEGRRECGRRGPRMTLSDYESELKCDPVALLAVYERDKALAARKAAAGTRDAFAAVIAGILDKVRGEAA